MNGVGFHKKISYQKRLRNFIKLLKCVHLYDTWMNMEKGLSLMLNDFCQNLKLLQFLTGSWVFVVTTSITTSIFQPKKTIIQLSVSFMNVLLIP